MIPQFLTAGPHPSCADLDDPDVMFRFLPHGKVPPEIVKMCHACPLYTGCLEYALNEPVEGIWAATTLKQRREMNPKMRESLGMGEYLDPGPRNAANSERMLARHAAEREAAAAI